MTSTRKTISRTAAKNLIVNSGGRFFTATAVTEKGEKREFKACRYDGQTSLGKLRVVENGKYKGINPATVTELKCNKMVYKVR